MHEQLGRKEYDLVVYKPKRGRFLGYKGTDFAEITIQQFIDDILGGNGEFKAVH